MGGLFETLQNNVSFFGDFADHATTLEAVDGVDAEGNNIAENGNAVSETEKGKWAEDNTTGQELLV